jgi:UDP-N-acetylmuramoyl-tripeptide--D-alanyl-D-alanine ligase
LKWTLAEIAAATGGHVHGAADADQAGAIATDTRGELDGAVFLALVGDRFDAHAFAAATQVEGRGPMAGVFSRPVDGWSRPWIQVADTTRALQDLGRAARARIHVPVVGLSGSNGKTTTRALIAAAISQLGRVHQTVGNLNNHLGVPMTLLATPDDAAAVVLEMGTSSPGEIRFLADLGEPDVRLLVNVGPAHLEELGGLPGVAREKGSLFDTARPGDVCVINMDDPYLSVMEPPCAVVTWRRRPSVPDGRSADVELLSAEVHPDSLVTTARFATPQGPVGASLAAPGEHIAHNAAGALAVAVALGLDVQRAADDLRAFAPVGMRLRAVPLPGGVRAINDAYNANPGSMRSTLAVLAALPGRRVAVLGDMLELGPDEAILHDEVARAAVDAGLDLVVLVGPRMSAARLEGGSRDSANVWRAVDGVSLAETLAAWLRPGDQVVFKGSRGARVERVLEAVSAALSAREGLAGAAPSTSQESR